MLPVHEKSWFWLARRTWLWLHARAWRKWIMFRFQSAQKVNPSIPNKHPKYRPYHMAHMDPLTLILWVIKLHFRLIEPITEAPSSFKFNPPRSNVHSGIEVHPAGGAVGAGDDNDGECCNNCQLPTFVEIANSQARVFETRNCAQTCVSSFFRFDLYLTFIWSSWPSSNLNFL